MWRNVCSKLPTPPISRASWGQLNVYLGLCDLGRQKIKSGPFMKDILVMISVNFESKSIASDSVNLVN